MPLDWAAFLGNQALLEVLLPAGADINAKDNLGYTPLDWAHVFKQTAIN